MQVDTYDNTRLSDFKRCPRKYYYRHILDWVPDQKQMPLIFGDCWHKGMEVVWQMAPEAFRSNPDHRAVVRMVADAAFAAFLDVWKTEYDMPYPLSSEEEKDMAPRTPQRAYQMYHGYLEARAHVLKDPSLKVLTVEKAFSVPLDPSRDDLWYVGKIDKVVDFRQKILAIEHKTTTQYSKGAKFRGSFLESFSPNSQVDGYQYCLHVTYPDRVGGVWVDAALVHRSDEGYTFIPVERQKQHLDSWLWEVQYWIAQVQLQKEWLSEVQPSHRYMSAFPKNTNACFDFGRACEYLGACKAWPNPVGKAPPPGFKIEHWDPLEHIGPIKDLKELELGVVT